MAGINKFRSAAATTTLKGKGMQLGKKKNVGLYDALNSEIASAEEATSLSATPTVPDSPRSPAVHAMSAEGISVQLTETATAKTNRDGGVESMDVQGQLNLQISDSSLSKISLALHASDADGTQFKTHPNVDRNLFKDQSKIGLRDASRPFPLNQQMCVLRWRLQAKPENTTLPISGSSLLNVLFLILFSEYVAYTSWRRIHRRQHRIRSRWYFS